MTCDLWLVTCDLWLVTCDLWLVTCDLSDDIDTKHEKRNMFVNLNYGIQAKQFCA